MNIGNAIKGIRKEKKISQGKLAQLCSISQTYLSQVEHNKKTPSLELIETIGNNLGIPISVILFLSLSEEDISDEKKDIFRVLNPSIVKFIEEIYIKKEEGK